jgi:hypothetical protein
VSAAAQVKILCIIGVYTDRTRPLHKRCRLRGLCIFLIAALSFSLLLNLAAQQSPDEIARILDRHPCADVSRVKIWHYDYVVASAAVEALSFVPTGAGPFLAALLIPGSQGTAGDLIPLGTPWPKMASRP